jgi:phosphoribosyl-AMP cyclohydrolase
MTQNWVVPTAEDVVGRAVFNDQGLIPVIAQDASSRDVLMLAWMNKDALQLTLREGRVTYFSRSRGELWRKGDTSGHIQHATRILLDCDGDSLLMDIHQQGPACHTGSQSCFDVGNAGE